MHEQKKVSGALFLAIKILQNPTKTLSFGISFRPMAYSPLTLDCCSWTKFRLGQKMFKIKLGHIKSRHMKMRPNGMNNMESSIKGSKIMIFLLTFPSAIWSSVRAWLSEDRALSPVGGLAAPDEMGQRAEEGDEDEQWRRHFHCTSTRYVSLLSEFDSEIGLNE